MICCAESTPRPRYFRQPFDRVLLSTEQICHLLVEFTDLLVDQSQFLKHHG